MSYPNDMTSNSVVQQSSALRVLENLLDTAIEAGDRSQHTGKVLLEIMNIEVQSRNIVDIYSVFGEARKEAESLSDMPKISRYLRLLDELYDVFTANNMWSTPWSVFADHIENKGVIPTLDALAVFVHGKSHSILLNSEFLEEISGEFYSTLEQVINSDLPDNLKMILVEGIEDILAAIRRYNIYGSDGLRKAAQSFSGNLIIESTRLSEKEKKNPIWSNIVPLVFSLRSFVTPSIYDVIPVVTSLPPRIEEFRTYCSQADRTIEEVGIQGFLKDIPCVVISKQQKMIKGSEPQKALPESKGVEQEKI